YQAGEEGKLLCEVLFPYVGDGVVAITHTFVDESLRGQGVASMLLDAATKDIRNRGEKARASCSYAASWFAKHPDECNLLVD
ncbi:MAG: N-acetyltransferase, partial [Eubacteriaceae bacterium]|nr:N-acetyltransferase [Eubacteriaceae bacterium]